MSRLNSIEEICRPVYVQQEVKVKKTAALAAARDIIAISSPQGGTNADDMYLLECCISIHAPYEGGDRQM